MSFLSEEKQMEIYQVASSSDQQSDMKELLAKPNDQKQQLQSTKLTLRQQNLIQKKAQEEQKRLQQQLESERKRQIKKKVQEQKQKQSLKKLKGQCISDYIQDFSNNNFCWQILYNKENYKFSYVAENFTELEETEHIEKTPRKQVTKNIVKIKQPEKIILTFPKKDKKNKNNETPEKNASIKQSIKQSNIQKETQNSQPQTQRIQQSPQMNQQDLGFFKNRLAQLENNKFPLQQQQQSYQQTMKNDNWAVDQQAQLFSQFPPQQSTGMPFTSPQQNFPQLPQNQLNFSPAMQFQQFQQSGFPMNLQPLLQPQALNQLSDKLQALQQGKQIQNPLFNFGQQNMFQHMFPLQGMNNFPEPNQNLTDKKQGKQQPQQQQQQQLPQFKYPQFPPINFSQMQGIPGMQNFLQQQMPTQQQLGEMLKQQQQQQTEFKESQFGFNK